MLVFQSYWSNSNKNIVLNDIPVCSKQYFGLIQFKICKGNNLLALIIIFNYHHAKIIRLESGVKII